MALKGKGIDPNRRQLLVPQHLWDEVNALAKFDMSNASVVTRTALKEYVERRKQVPVQPPVHDYPKRAN